MTLNDLTLSCLLWLCVGFLIGYRYHVLKVRDDREREERDAALDELIADVAVRCIEHPTDARVN